jgi:alanine dehydrogenase
MKIIGVPKEIKNNEFRVSLTPSSVSQLILEGNKVFIQEGAGLGAGFLDHEYEKMGAKILKTAKEIFDLSDMIVKVKEPQKSELFMLKKNQILYTYLHLAPDPEQTKGLIDSGCTAIAYETITDDHGRLPLLAPMSEVAGRLSVQVGAQFLQKKYGGLGILLGGTPGTKKANVLILGGGYAGANACEIALGMGANVWILDKNNDRLKKLHSMFGGRVQTLYSTNSLIEDLSKEADLLISSVLVPGALTPRVITREILRKMKKGSVFVDISIDQGGSSETSRPTTHEDPVFVEEGVIHYCVANMPGAVPRTSTIALNNATLKFASMLAKHGIDALKKDLNLRNGLNVFDGKITNKKVAESLGHKFFDPVEILK